MRKMVLFGLVIAGLLVASSLVLNAQNPGAQQAAARPQDPMTMTFVENTLTAEEKAAGWKLLFDGKTTDGWRAYKQQTATGWRALDGALMRVARGGDLITVDQYENFELHLDWKLEAGGNSGVMYRVSESEEESYFTGPEVQVLDNARHRDGKNPLTSAGSCFGLYAPSKDVTRPPGSWNSMRLIVNKNHVEHWLNGTKVVEYEMHSADWNEKVQASKFKQWPNFGRMPRGHIALQDHGNPVAYRNIRIRVLETGTGSR